MAQQFDEAVRLAEAAFIEQFADVVSHLCDRLSKGDDGQPKIFRDSAVFNLSEFFERFKSLNLRSNAQLDSLVEQAREAIKGSNPNRLRTSADLREKVAGKLAEVERTLTGMMTDKPRRRILRPTAIDAGGRMMTITIGSRWHRALPLQRNHRPGRIRPTGHHPRHSHVEPDESGRWIADLSPVSGPALGPFPTRSAALAAEAAWLEANRL